MLISNKENQREWNALQDELLKVFKKEISLRQEILSNINQQEYLLLIGNIELRNELQVQIKNIGKELKKWKKERTFLTQKLLKLIPTDTQITSIEKLFDSSDENDWEGLVLYEKLKLLIKKIHKQQNRNKSLFEMIQKEGPTNLSTQSLQAKPLYSDNHETKPFLITIDYPEEE